METFFLGTAASLRQRGSRFLSYRHKNVAFCPRNVKNDIS